MDEELMAYVSGTYKPVQKTVGFGQAAKRA